jgi:hypothetical protein
MVSTTADERRRIIEISGSSTGSPSIEQTAFRGWEW